MVIIQASVTRFAFDPYVAMSMRVWIITMGVIILGVQVKAGFKARLFFRQNRPPLRFS
jgi:hypothetical protein